MKLDNIDATILSELTINACASQVELAERVGLSSTAIARRQKVLEEEGFIRGYQAVLDLTRFGLSTGHPGKSKRGGVEIVRSRSHRLSVGGSMLPDGPVDHTSIGTHRLWTWQPPIFQRRACR